MGFSRLLVTGQLSEERAEQLRQVQRGSDPLALLETIRRCQEQLVVLASGEQGSGLGPGAAVADRTQESRSLEVFLGDLRTLWQSSQPRRRKPRTRTGKRTRPDLFEADVTLIEGWLEEEPLLGCRELMERLVALDPQRYSDRQLRTLQQRLRGYRLQRIELEMAEIGEVHGHAKAREAGDPSDAVVLMRPAPGAWRPAQGEAKGKQSSGQPWSSTDRCSGSLWPGGPKSLPPPGPTKPSPIATSPPWAAETQCYQVTTIFGNNFLMQGGRRRS